MEMLELSLLNIPSDKEKQFKNKKIEDLYTLVRYTPTKYFNLERKSREIGSLTNLDENKVVEVIGTLTNIKEDPWSKRVSVSLSDGTGKISVVWFNQPYLAKRLHENMTYSVVGKIQIFWGAISIQSPLYCSADSRDFHRIIPQYTKIRGMSQEYIQNCAYKSIESIQNLGEDYLTPAQLKELDVPSDVNVITDIHFPQTKEQVKRAGRRYVIDHLFPFAAHLAYKQRFSNIESRFFITKTEETQKMIRSLPFPLTEDQQKAINKIIEMIRNKQTVDALIQGDVGCGKTIVAVILAKAMTENGYQIAIMAPTNVLAEQHFAEFSKYGLEPILLTGKMKAKEKREAIKHIKAGDVSVVIGTHALIAENVEYKNLGMVVVDEEHRFGVAQREKLLEKTAEMGMHKISMSATPIPRSLASAVYGKNTQLLDIHTMPAGRKPITTCMCHSHKSLFESIRHQIADGHQCYIVCPFIEDSSAEATKDVVSAETCYAACRKSMSSHPEISVGLISGKMKASEIDDVIQKFSNNQIQILISTTIVEVGVNVPNATVMVVENAERFGLAQLHQLRGRVGRGNAQSYCVLMTKKENKDNERLKIMLTTNDGFKVAEADARNRGIGDLSGEEQSGFTKIMELVTMFPNLYHKIQTVIDKTQRTEKDWQELFDKMDGIKYITRANFALVAGTNDILPVEVTPSAVITDFSLAL